MLLAESSSNRSKRDEIRDKLFFRPQKRAKGRGYPSSPHGHGAKRPKRDKAEDVSRTGMTVGIRCEMTRMHQKEVT